MAFLFSLHPNLVATMAMAVQTLFGSVLAVPTLLVVATFFLGHGSMSPTSVQYTVGDSVWSIPPTNYFYTTWSSSHSFRPGDSLLFEFESERYNVMQVSKAEYEACTAEHPLKALTEGPTVINLIEEGEFFYICSILNYCALGQKLSVIVVHHDPPSPSSAAAAAPLHVI